jgi:hypothetical protein
VDRYRPIFSAVDAFAPQIQPISSQIRETYGDLNPVTRFYYEISSFCYEIKHYRSRLVHGWWLVQEYCTIVTASLPPVVTTRCISVIKSAVSVFSTLSDFGPAGRRRRSLPKIIWNFGKTGASQLVQLRNCKLCALPWPYFLTCALCEGARPPRPSAALGYRCCQRPGTFDWA